MLPKLKTCRVPMSDMQRSHHQNRGAGTSGQTQDFFLQKGAPNVPPHLPQCHGLFCDNVLLCLLYIPGDPTQMGPLRDMSLTPVLPGQAPHYTFPWHLPLALLETSCI